MVRRYIIVGFVFFLLIGAYFIFFNDKDNNKDYENYYIKLIEKRTYSDYLDDVNVSIKEIEENNKYTYILTFDGVSEIKSDVKILVLDEHCTKDDIEKFPSFGIIANKGYSLVKEGNEDENKKYLKGVNLTVIGKDKIDNFLIYFKSGNTEQFAKISVTRN